MFGFTCFVRLLTEQKLKVSLRLSGEFPAPLVCCKEGRGRRENLGKNPRNAGIVVQMARGQLGAVTK